MTLNKNQPDNETLSIIKLLKKGQINYQNLEPHWRANTDVTLAAVTNKGWMLEHANESCQDNPQIVFAAINQYPPAIKFASKRLQNNSKLREILTKFPCNTIDFDLESGTTKEDQSLKQALTKYLEELQASTTKFTHNASCFYNKGKNNDLLQQPGKSPCSSSRT